MDPIVDRPISLIRRRGETLTTAADVLDALLVRDWGRSDEHQPRIARHLRTVSAAGNAAPALTEPAELESGVMAP